MPAKGLLKFLGFFKLVALVGLMKWLVPESFFAKVHDIAKQDLFLMNVKEYYDVYLSKTERSVVSSFKLLRIIEILRYIHKVRSSGLKNLQILDFGCGEGILSGMLSHVGKVTGCDISSRAIEMARARFPEVHFFEINAENSTIDQTYDLVVSQEVIEHIHNKEHYLQTCYASLRSHGYLILTTPNKHVFDHRSGGNWSNQPIEELVTIKQLKQLLKRNFKVKSLSTVGMDVADRGVYGLFNNRYLVQFLRLTGLNGFREVLLRYIGFGLHVVVLAQRRD